MRSLGILATCFVLALAGCGGDDDTATGPAENGGAPAAGPNTIIMKDIAFSPAELRVKVGDTVKWVNEDDVEHDAAAEGDEFKSDLFGKGGTFEYKADKAGTIKYVCTVHPGMEGTIVVE